MKNQSQRLSLFGSALIESFLMLKVKEQIKNPVMFVTYLGAIFTTAHLFILRDFSFFQVQIVLWLWFTVLFANFAQSLAEAQGRSQAASLRKNQVQMKAKKLNGGDVKLVHACDLVKGDLIECVAGDIIAADGDVVEGIATVDESAITGESAPVIRESGGDRSAVTAGTKVASDRIVIRVTSAAGESFIDRMIQLIEGAKRQRTPNEIALHIVLSALTFLFVLTVASLKGFSDYTSKASHQDVSHIVTVPVLIALLVCLIPTTISALLSAVSIAGMHRLVRHNVIAKSGRAVEAAGDIDLLLLDKTGTITLGNRQCAAFFPAEGVSEKEFATIAQLSSLGDETPEGRSIVIFAKERFGLRAESFVPHDTKVIAFSAKTRMSGIDFLNAEGHTIRSIRKGAVDAIREYVGASSVLDKRAQEIAMSGGTPLYVSDGRTIVGIIHLKDIIKGGIKERFQMLRRMGIRTVMITGDNPFTAAAIAAEAGVDDYVAEANPEAKLALIRREQQGGRLVAMTGDGTNDAPALAQADVGVAMNTGTQASREAGNMVDLESNPTKLIDIVEVGKEMLITRGALTTFSIANDVAKYFAILPALFGSFYDGQLMVLNVMHLHSPQSAVLSAVIFNALIIFALIPLSLKGIRYKGRTANGLLRRNVLIYGLGGIVIPFLGIKAIDMFLYFLGRHL